ncbi:MAG TPA: hypothetical protein VFA89_10990 [Terriglobales bacterium]|nr:hypothetical protein [Terriglobales bacterium]
MREATEVTMTPEPFASAEQAAAFLGIERRHLLALARKGIPGAYAVDPGRKRKIWIFRLSELATGIAEQPAGKNGGHGEGVALSQENRVTMRSAVSRA